MKVKVAGQGTNVMIDTGAVRNVVSKRFLDEVGLEIDAPPDRTLIGVSGKVTTPLRTKYNLPVKIGNTRWNIEAAVMETEAYILILGNE